MFESSFHSITMGLRIFQENKSSSIPVVRFFELLGFAIAFILLFVFFSRFGLNYEHLAILAFIISLSISKTDLMLYLLRNMREISIACGKAFLFPFKALLSVLKRVLRALKSIFQELWYYFRSIFYVRNISDIINQVKLAFAVLLSSVQNWTFESLYFRFKHGAKRLHKVVYRIVFYSVVLLKQLFFNVSYDLFPMLLIWLSILGVVILFDWIELPIGSEFITSITAFSILLGLFQYFLKRHEEKIFSKIAQIQNRVNKIVIEESSFDNFYKTVDNSLVKDFIKWNIEPKLTGIDFFKMAFADIEFREIYNKYSKERRPIPIQLGLSNNLSSDQKYSLLELIAENPSESYKKELLSDAYEKFFSDIAYHKIIKRIHNEIDTQEFGILAMSNINILQEVLPDLINIKLQKAFDNITMDTEIKPNIPEPISQLYRQYLLEKVNVQLQRDFLY